MESQFTDMRNLTSRNAWAYMRGKKMYCSEWNGEMFATAATQIARHSLRPLLVPSMKLFLSSRVHPHSEKPKRRSTLIPFDFRITFFIKLSLSTVLITVGTWIRRCWIIALTVSPI